MAADLATLNAVLKNNYTIGYITEELNQAVDAWLDFEDTTLPVVGGLCILPLHTSRNAGVGAAGDGAPTPIAGQQGYKNLQITPKYVYGVAQITGPALAAAANSQGSFAIEFKAEMDGLVTDMRKKMSKYTFTGGNGIGFVWQRQNGPFTWEYSGRPDIATDPDYGVAVGVGQTVSFVRLSDYAIIGAGTQVNSITNDTLTLAGVIDTTGGTLADAYLVVHNGNAFVNGQVQALSLEPTGFAGNFGLQSLFGLDRSLATNARLRCIFRKADPTTSAKASLTTDGMAMVIARIAQESGKRPTKMWMSWIQQVAYQSLMVNVVVGGVGTSKSPNLRRDIHDKAGHADPGDLTFGYAGVPIKPSDVCPGGSIYFTLNDSWTRVNLGGKDGHWVDQGGSPMVKVQNADAYQATYALYYEQVCRAPNQNGLITGIEVPA